MQLRLRFCNGIEQGARSRDVQGVIGLIGRLSARVHLSDWAMRAFDPSVYRSSVPHLNKNARGVTCVAQHTQRIRTERRSVSARSPPAVGAGAWSERCMMLAWKGFVLAGFLIAAVSCSDALGFGEQSAEVEFGNGRTCEFQLSSLTL